MFYHYSGSCNYCSLNYFISILCLHFRHSVDQSECPRIIVDLLTRRRLSKDVKEGAFKLLGNNLDTDIIRYD